MGSNNSSKDTVTRANWVPTTGSVVLYFSVPLFALQCKPTALATASPRSSTDFLQVHILQKPFSPYLLVLCGYRILTPGPHPPPNDTRVSLDGAQAASYTSPKLTSPLYFWKARLLPSSHSNLSSPNAKPISIHSKSA